jgi:hypothetical protein
MTPPRRRGRPRLARRLGFDHNGLRRRSDRVESAITVILLLGFLLGVPSLGVMTARTVHENEKRAARAAAARHPVTAVLTVTAPDARSSRAESGRPARPLATARWSYDGIRHIGKVRATPGSEPGTKVRIWVDDRGWNAGPPQAAATDHTRPAVLVAGLFMIASSAMIWMTRRGVRWVFIRRQLPAWEAEWAMVAPHWTGRR